MQPLLSPVGDVVSEPHLVYPLNYLKTMAINLQDFNSAVRDYFAQKVTVTIENFRLTGQNPGTDLNPGETFAFKIRIANARASNGGVQLNKIKILIFVTPAGSGNPNDGHLKVPSALLAITTNDVGVVQQPGRFFDTFNIEPISNAFKVIQVGEIVEIE